MIVTFTNPTASPVYVSMLNQTIGPGLSASAERTQSELDAEQQLKDLVAAGQITLSYTAEAEDAGVGSLSADIANYPVVLYADPVTGSDAADGTLAAPMKTFEAMMDRKPAVYHQSCRFNLNITPTPSTVSTAKKVYTLSNQALQFLFPTTEGKNGESVLLQGGYTNEFGDLTATAGSTISLTSGQNLTLDQMKGAMIFCVSGTGAGTNAPRVIRGNTAGPNSVFTPEVAFTVAPDATTVYRIGYPNVQIQFSQRVLLCAPPQNAYMRGIEWVFTGTGAGTQTLQFGNMIGEGGGGAFICTGSKFNLGSGGNRAGLLCRGTARLEMDGVNTSWVGPNNPITSDESNTGNYIHGGQTVGTNVGGMILFGATLIKDCVLLSAQSAGSTFFNGGTVENSPIVAGGDGLINFSAPTSALRARVRLLTGTAVTIQNLGKGVANNGPDFNNVEFSDITGDMVLVQSNANAVLGDITIAGTNTGLGLKVLTGGRARVQSTTLLSGNGGAIQVDTGPVMTLAQALAAPFGGTLLSNVVQPYPITDPGNAGAISVVTNGVAALTSTGAQTRTVAAPTYVGQMLTICCDVFAGNIAITFASAFNQANNTIVTLTAAGQQVTVCGAQIAGAKRWRLISNDGATLS